MLSDEKSIRTFLAIELPAEVMKDIGVVQTRLKKSLQGIIRWVRPEGIHLTLKFFGDISERDSATISRIVADHASGIKPFTLYVRTLGAFPDLNRPRVIWLGVGGDVQRLMLFQKSLDQKLYENGFAKEEQSFKPHLTLARIKEHRGLIGLAKAVEKRDNYEAGHFNAGELVLFRSRLTPAGAVYTKLACFPFSG